MIVKILLIKIKYKKQFLELIFHVFQLNKNPFFKLEQVYFYFYTKAELPISYDHKRDQVTVFVEQDS